MLFLYPLILLSLIFFFQAEDGIRDSSVTGVQTCALPILLAAQALKLGLKPTRRTKTGFSTDAATLESLRGQHDIVEALLEYRELSKLQATYLDPLPRLLDPKTGRVHATFKQTAVATGRIATESPNLQNIPVRSELGRQIRR